MLKRTARNSKLLFRIAIPVPAHEAREELNTYFLVSSFVFQVSSLAGHSKLEI